MIKRVSALTSYNFLDLEKQLSILRLHKSNIKQPIILKTCLRIMYDTFKNHPKKILNIKTRHTFH